MEQLLYDLAICIERGKIERISPYPQDMQSRDGASELTEHLLDAGIPATDILKQGLMVGMQRIGEKFERGVAFIPDLLIAAKAMNTAMVHLKQHFKSGDNIHRGSFVLGTVMGDLHDIGKNIVKMVLEGSGWKVIDLGSNVPVEKYLEAVKGHPDCMIGLSALLTTTLANMERTVKEVKGCFPDVRVFIGGAPVTSDFNRKIGADGSFRDPHALVRFLSDEE